MLKKIEDLMAKKAREILAGKKADVVIAWRKGEFSYDNAPALYESEDALKDLVYDCFCGPNLSKYLIQMMKAGKKAAIFLKPCDTYGVNQLLKDQRAKRELIWAIGTPCCGMLDMKKIKEAAGATVLSVTDGTPNVKIETVEGVKEVPRNSLLLVKCMMCKGNEYKIADEELGEKLETPHFAGDRFAQVKAIEALDEKERYAFWKEELSKCIRCNTCRDVCPACSCEQCIFDHPGSAVAGKAYVDAAQEAMFHVIRAFHVAGRCTGCGECERACPQGIRLGLLNLKFTKDINELYGPYQPGEDAETKAPQVDFSMDDPEPSAARRG